MTNPFDLILFHGLATPRRPAVMANGGFASYSHLCRSVLVASSNVLMLGLNRNGIVGLRLRDPYLHLITILALGRLGIPSVSFANDAKASFPLQVRLTDQPDDSAPTASLTRTISIDERFYGDAGQPTQLGGADYYGHAFGPGDLVRICLSSGTTGAPKPIALSASVVEARLSTPTLTASPAGTAERLISLMGLATSWGYFGALKVLRCGGTVCFPGSELEALDMASFLAVDHFVVSAHQLETLVRQQRQVSRDLPALHTVHVGGSDVPDDILRDAERLLTRGVMLTYGSAETGRVAAIQSVLARQQRGSVGFVYPWLRLETVDEADRPTPIGVEGILRIQGPTVACGLGQAAPGPAQHWHRPGDIGVLAADRSLRILGRTDGRINRLGVKFTLEEVESAMTRLAAIREAAAARVLDPSGRELVVAFYVAEGDIDAATWRTAIPPEQMPDRFQPIDIIPRTQTGKIDRAALAALTGQ